MSLHAGILCLDQRPISPTLTASIGQYLSRLGPDGGSDHVAPGLAMIYRAVHVTPEDLAEQQPFISPLGHVITWDGRLDNRADLLLALWRDVPPEAPDAVVVMAAYHKWQDDAFARLIGDWSLVIWDQQSHELKLASDYAGNRPLYVVANDTRIDWSSCLAELVIRRDCKADLDPRFMVGYMTHAIPPGVTPYRGVCVVPPANVLTWTQSGGSRRRRFWDFSIDCVRYKDSRDYEVALRSLVLDAVRARLRSTRPVWAELSGGLDSSTVVCVADRVSRTESMGSSVETVSYITDLAPESDERPFIGAVELQRGRDGHHVRAESCVDMIDTSWHWVTPLHPSGTALGVFRLVQSNAGRVLMSGNPGDLIMMNYPEDTGAILDALTEGSIAALTSRLHEWCIACKQPIWPLLFTIATQCMPLGRGTRNLRNELRILRVSTRNILRGAAEGYHLTDRAAQMWFEDAQKRESLLHTRRLSRIATLHSLRTCIEQWQLRTFPEMQLTYTHPYLSRPLVQFMLAVPADVTCRPGRPRLLMRRALGDVLPERVARRFSKGYVQPFRMRKLRAWLPHDAAALDHLRVVQRDYVDRDRLRRAMEGLHAGQSSCVRNLEAILTLERWLSSRERSATEALELMVERR